MSRVLLLCNALYSYRSSCQGCADPPLFGSPRRYHAMQHVETRQLYAIKVFSVFDRDKRAQLLKEVETLWGMECPSLINFVGGYLKVRICRTAVRFAQEVVLFSSSDSLLARWWKPVCFGGEGMMNLYSSEVELEYRDWRY